MFRCVRNIRRLLLITMATHNILEFSAGTVAACQAWLSQGTLDVLVISFGIKPCTLDVLVRLVGHCGIIHGLINNSLIKRL